MPPKRLKVFQVSNYSSSKIGEKLPVKHIWQLWVSHNSAWSIPCFRSWKNRNVLLEAFASHFLQDALHFMSEYLAFWNERATVFGTEQMLKMWTNVPGYRRKAPVFDLQQQYKHDVILVTLLGFKNWACRWFHFTTRPTIYTHLFGCA